MRVRLPMTRFTLNAWLQFSIRAGLFVVICTTGVQEARAQTEDFPIDGSGSTVRCLSAGAIERTGRPFGSFPTSVTGCVLAQDAPFGLAAPAISVYCKGGYPIQFHPRIARLRSCTLSYDTRVPTAAGAAVACASGIQAHFDADGRMTGCDVPTAPPAGSATSTPQAPTPPAAAVVPGGSTARRALTTDASAGATAARVGPAGAIVRVDTPGSPLLGLALSVPPGAYAETRDVRVSYRPIARHGYGADVNPVSPLITVEAGAGYASAGITVRVPIVLPAGHFAMGFYYEETTGRLEGMPLVELGADHATVLTRHFSSFFITSIAVSLLLDLDIDTGFAPGVDDWQFLNEGSHLEPGGHCAGQSVSAMWYFYERRRANGERPLFGRYDNNGATPTPEVWEDDTLGYRLASVVQHDLQWETTLRKSMLAIESIDERTAYLSLAQAMRLTGGPQYLAVRATREDVGHAVVAYRISGGKVFVADPNRPGIVDRSIAVVADRFGTYRSEEVASGTSRLYDMVRYIAVSAMIDWAQVGRRWAELDAASIGAGSFPRYDVVFKDDAGTVLTPRNSALTTASSPITVTVVMPEYEPGTIVGGIISLGDPGLAQAPTAVFASDRVLTLRPGDNTVSVLLVGATIDRSKPAWVDFRRYRVTLSSAEAPTTGHWALRSTEHAQEQPFESREPDCPAVRQSATDQSVTFTVAFRGACTYDRGTATVTTAWTAPPVLVPGKPLPMTLTVNGTSGIVAQDGVNLHRVQGTIRVETSLYQCRGAECRASGTRESQTAVWTSFEPGALPSGTVVGSTTFSIEASDTPIARPANFQPTDVFRIAVRSSEMGEGGGLATTMRHVVTHTYAWQPAR